MQKYFKFLLIFAVLTLAFAYHIFDWFSWTISPTSPSSVGGKGVDQDQNMLISNKNINSTTPISNEVLEGLNKTTAKDVSIDSWIKQNEETKKRPNILFMVADDMRPEIGAYLHEHSPWLEPGIITPNLDTLAKQAVVFRRAYCQFSWCNPSRSSLLTSRRPDTTMVHNNSVFFRQNNPNLVTLPQYFKDNGYVTLGMGKIFHLMNIIGDNDEDYSWSQPMFRPNAEKMLIDGSKTWGAVQDKDRDGKLLLDETVVRRAKNTLHRLDIESRTTKKPFFLAVGFKKPHLNWYFPEKFMQGYPLDKISLPSNPTASPSLPEVSWFHSFEIRGRPEYLNETKEWSKTQALAEWVTRELRRAYYSCITYVDDLVGQILQQLHQLGIANNTIVSFIGDHGFHLGEHSIVGKNTVFEVANNVPMMLHIPGVTDQGMVLDKLVEFVDLYPTFAELAGLPPVPYCPEGNKSGSVNVCTEGTSLVPLLRDPATATWKDRAFYQYPHYLGYAKAFCMGYSMRTPQYRYTEWVHYDYDADVKANWTHSYGTELYDHTVDPHETKNLADDAALSEIRSTLSAKLRAGWFAALPQKQ